MQRDYHAKQSKVLWLFRKALVDIDRLGEISLFDTMTVPIVDGS